MLGIIRFKMPSYFSTNTSIVDNLPPSVDEASINRLKASRHPHCCHTPTPPPPPPPSSLIWVFHTRLCALPFRGTPRSSRRRLKASGGKKGAAAGAVLPLTCPPLAQSPPRQPSRAWALSSSPASGGQARSISWSVRTAQIRSFDE